MRAYVLIKTQIGTVDAVRTKLADAIAAYQRQLAPAQRPSLQALDVVTGHFDIIAVVIPADPAQIAHLVVRLVQQTDGVVETLTLLHLGSEEPKHETG